MSDSQSTSFGLRSENHEVVGTVNNLREGGDSHRFSVGISVCYLCGEENRSMVINMIFTSSPIPHHLAIVPLTAVIENKKKT